MPSHKSSPDDAVEPKRERGRLRVASILDAAASLFAEKGYEGTTMTEVAFRSQTAIGSLYRFFPTKTALAAALAQRYAEAIGRRLDALEAAAAHMAAADLAAAFVDLMFDNRRERAAVVLLEGSAEVDRRRAALRARYRDGIAAILHAARPGATLVRAEPAGAATLQILKGVARVSAEGGDTRSAIDELRRALALLLADVLDPARQPTP